MAQIQYCTSLIMSYQIEEINQKGCSQYSPAVADTLWFWGLLNFFFFFFFFFGGGGGGGGGV